MNRASVFEIPTSDISLPDINIDREPFSRGWFGEVYEAKLGQQNVVVKAINAWSEEEKQVIESETRVAMQRLGHRNVVKLFGITVCVRRIMFGFMTERKLGIVMEKAQHGSLDSWIGKMDREQETKIALGIIDGLEYVHSKNVIHRDIKPKNILMFGPPNDMIPKISDFGVSKVIETLTQHTVQGTQLYMAPEIRKHLQYGLTADIYSLAMMLFEMFNEQLTTEASNDEKTFVLSAYSGMIGQMPDSCKVPVHLRTVIIKGFSVNPELRPSLSEYRSALQGWVLFIYYI